MDAVTEVLLDRSRDAQKLSRMVVLSLILHGILLTLLTVVPRLTQSASPPSEHVMNISLAGPVGPIQGRNAEAAREIQQAAPETKTKTDTPPALVKPEMTEALKTAKPLPKAVEKPQPKKETQVLHGRTPTQGAEVRPGQARVDTQGAAKPFGGLATGGGGANMAYTDYADFCCPEYLAGMTRLIYGNWQQHQGQDGANVVKFVIHRDGSITDVKVDQGANPYLNLASQRALAQTQRLPPLPAAFTGSQLTVYLAFQYKR